MLARVHGLDKRPSDMRSGLVHQYIEFYFEPLEQRMYSMLMTQFITYAILVKKNVAGPNGLTLLCSTSWMVFDMLVKSMVLASKTEQLASMTTERMRQFAADTPRLLKRLFSELRSIVFACFAEPSRSQGKCLFVKNEHF